MSTPRFGPLWHCRFGLAGLAEAVKKTGAWVITGGHTDGVGASLAGRAMQYGRMEYGTSTGFNCIGICPWETTMVRASAHPTLRPSWPPRPPPLLSLSQGFLSSTTVGRPSVQRPAGEQGARSHPRWHDLPIWHPDLGDSHLRPSRPSSAASAVTLAALLTDGRPTVFIPSSRLAGNRDQGSHDTMHGFLARSQSDDRVHSFSEGAAGANGHTSSPSSPSRKSVNFDQEGQKDGSFMQKLRDVARDKIRVGARARAAILFHPRMPRVRIFRTESQPSPCASRRWNVRFAPDAISTP